MHQKNNIEIKFLLLGLCMILLGSCSLLHLGKEKNGCPTGNNIGAERIMAGDPVALKAAKKANKKNKQAKMFSY